MERVLQEIDCSMLSYEWPKWKRSFIMYMMASGKDLEPEAQKIATFLWLAGSKVTEIYSTLFPNDGTAHGMVGTMVTSSDPSTSAAVVSRTLEDVLKAFDDYSIPFRNITMESYKFNNIVQTEGQPFIEFETQLRKQLQLCDYKCDCGRTYEERMLLDRFIIGIQDKKLQLKLLELKNKKLEEIITECKAFEAAAKNNDLLRNPHYEKSVDVVVRRCYNCGAIFNPNHLSECRAKGMACYYCGKIGHFSKYCKQQKKRVDNNNYNSSNRRVDNNNISNKRVDNNNYKSKQIDVDRKQTAGAVINWIESGKKQASAG
ncbi:uncharacterized protein [Drosophila suzukii]|uniref:Uncharacterized protein isoform X3 n=2 Tax=suzukii subgroup TaxID=32353 RepID=A0ABM4TRI3_DROSZ